MAQDFRDSSGLGLGPPQSGLGQVANIFPSPNSHPDYVPTTILPPPYKDYAGVNLSDK